MKKALMIYVVFPLLFGAVASAGSSKHVKLSGYISDSVCGAQAETVGYGDCTNKCLSKGAQVVIVVDDTKNLLAIDNPEAVKGHECHHVLVTGDVNLQASTLHVLSLRII